MNNYKNLTKQDFKQIIIDSLRNNFSVTPDEATEVQIYKALSLAIVEHLRRKRRYFVNGVHSHGKKQVYYLSMEFLMGRSLKTNLHNLQMADIAKEALKDFDFDLEKIYEYEPDAGLGNGGLGRLAACYLDGLATQGYAAMGYSICYEYGIFKQKIEEGWQTELPDNWLPGGETWLVKKADRAVEVKFDGELHEYWQDGDFYTKHVNTTKVLAMPYDMYVSGFDTKGVSVLRLWKAETPSFNMDLFNKGEYSQALTQNTMAQSISKVLYPNDNHMQGKSLRLRQQYFMCCASVTDIVNHHMSVYGTLDNLHEKVAIHINDTHPTLAIPELMRILIDDCGYEWEKAWHIVSHTFAYTNHTVMSEALEKWDINLMRDVIPRIVSIILEINRRYCEEIFAATNDTNKTTRMSIVANNQIKMANLCVCASHSINGVSKLHSEIIKQDVFFDQYQYTPNKFKNVTNGIAYRRWLYQSNPNLTKLLKSLLGKEFLKDASNLRELTSFENDETVLNKLAEIKHKNKIQFSKYVKNKMGIVLNTDSIFDVQVKRLHEYKRQHLNALNIISEYNYLLENPNADFVPKTYIFAAKAAPGYYMAKQIIKLIWSISKELRQNKKLNEKLSVLFLEDYCVTLSELLMPASEISEQISLAGTEASGTGNMKLMLNGAVTLGTMDGANVEIYDAIGKDNIITFGMSPQEAVEKKYGYNPERYYNENEIIKGSISKLLTGFAGSNFEDIANSLKHSDPYMVLADFADYQKAEKYASECYMDKKKWNKMSLRNIAGAGVFSADRAVDDYARDIWHLKK